MLFITSDLPPSVSFVHLIPAQFKIAKERRVVDILALRGDHLGMSKIQFAKHTLPYGIPNLTKVESFRMCPNEAYEVEFPVPRYNSQWDSMIFAFPTDVVNNMDILLHNIFFRLCNRFDEEINYTYAGPKDKDPVGYFKVPPCLRYIEILDLIKDAFQLAAMDSETTFLMDVGNPETIPSLQDQGAMLSPLHYSRIDLARLEQTFFQMPGSQPLYSLADVLYPERQRLQRLSYGSLSGA